jgi:hypothetical protein
MDDSPLVPAWFAAKRMGVSRQVVNYWRTSGRLPVADKDDKGRPLYRWGDVLEAERQTRRTANSSRNPNRRRPTDGPDSWTALDRQTAVA